MFAWQLICLSITAPTKPSLCNAHQRPLASDSEQHSGAASLCNTRRQLHTITGSILYTVCAPLCRASAWLPAASAPTARVTFGEQLEWNAVNINITRAAVAAHEHRRSDVKHRRASRRARFRGAEGALTSPQSWSTNQFCSVKYANFQTVERKEMFPQVWVACCNMLLTPRLRLSSNIIVTS